MESSRRDSNIVYSGSTLMNESGEQCLTQGKYSIFICWVNKYVNHSNKWCFINFLGGFFSLKLLCTMCISSIIIPQHFLEISSPYIGYLFISDKIPKTVRFICMCFISIAIFLSIYNPKKYLNSLNLKKMYTSMNKFWFTIWKEAKKQLLRANEDNLETIALNQKNNKNQYPMLARL